MIDFSPIFPLHNSHIHATIKGSFIHKIRGLLIEGNISMVKNFSVQKNKEWRRILVENRLMIAFSANTLIKPVAVKAPSILRHKFKLFPFEKQEERPGKGFVLMGKKTLIFLLLFWGHKLWSFIIIELLI